MLSMPCFCTGNPHWPNSLASSSFHTGALLLTSLLSSSSSPLLLLVSCSFYFSSAGWCSCFRPSLFLLSPACSKRSSTQSPSLFHWLFLFFVQHHVFPMFESCSWCSGLYIAKLVMYCKWISPLRSKAHRCLIDRLSHILGSPLVWTGVLLLHSQLALLGIHAAAVQMCNSAACVVTVLMSCFWATAKVQLSAAQHHLHSQMQNHVLVVGFWWSHARCVLDLQFPSTARKRMAGQIVTFCWLACIQHKWIVLPCIRTQCAIQASGVSVTDSASCYVVSLLQERLSCC